MEAGGFIQEVDVWSDEWTPIKAGTRSVRDWAREHLEGSDYWKDPLPMGYNLEVLIIGEIVGKYFPPSGEYDEWMEYSVFDFRVLPPDFFG